MSLGNHVMQAVDSPLAPHGSGDQHNPWINASPFTTKEVLTRMSLLMRLTLGEQHFLTRKVRNTLHFKKFRDSRYAPLAVTSNK